MKSVFLAIALSLLIYHKKFYKKNLFSSKCKSFQELKFLG